MSVLAIDAGTSVIKGVVFGDDGVELAVSRGAVEISTPRAGWAEQDMASVWATVVSTAREALAQVSEPVRLLTCTAQGDGCWLVDREGEPVGPAILWCDGRASEIVERWRQDGVVQEAFRENGSVTFAGLSNAVLTWLAEHEPDRLERADTMLSAGGWLFSRLTGHRVVDESDASAPFLDLTSRTYSARLIEMFGLGGLSGLLPEVRGDADRVERLRERAAAELGVPAGLPVVLAPYDVAATAIGAGAVSSGQACAILGTTLCTEIVQDTVSSADTPTGLTVAFGSARVVRAFPTLSGTDVLDWACHLLDVHSPQQLAELAAVAEPTGRPVFLPYLSPAGERVPFFDPHARGTFWGLSLEHGRHAVARAVFEGLSLTIQDCLHATATAPAELRLAGGGAGSDFWCQLIADVTGLSTLRSVDTEIGAKGAFLTGLVAVGAERGLDSAADRHVRADTRFAPDTGMAAHYTTGYSEFVTLREIARRGWEHQAERGQTGAHA